MLPSMRYQTKKLAQLHHMRKSYRDHRRSIEKIKKRQLQSSVERTQDINQLRNRMHSAFNYTQYIRAKQINKDNFLLYKKCTDDKRSNISLRINQRKINNQQNVFGLKLANGQSFHRLNNNNSDLNENRDGYLLKNHRNSPIHKLTNYQRSRQNLRLAVKIAKPCPAINTKKLQEIHEQTKRHKQRIMKYDSISLKQSHLQNRSSKYLQKKLSNDSFRSHRLSISLKSNERIEKQNPQSPTIKKQASKTKDSVIKKLYRTSIFRNKHNDHSYGFSLTDYKS